MQKQPRASLPLSFPLSLSFFCCSLITALAAWAPNILPAPEKTPLEMPQLLPGPAAQPGCPARPRASSGSLPEGEFVERLGLVSLDYPTSDKLPRCPPSSFSIHRGSRKDRIFLLTLFCNPGKCLTYLTLSNLGKPHS